MGPETTDAFLRRGAFAALMAAIGVFRFVDPAEAAFLPPCLFHWATGLYCPGCGAGRALHALAQGDLASALAMNPLLVVALPLLLALILWPRLAYHPRTPMLVFAVLIGFAVLRNLPLWPFSWLAPG